MPSVNPAVIGSAQFEFDPTVVRPNTWLPSMISTVAFGSPVPVIDGVLLHKTALLTGVSICGEAGRWVSIPKITWFDWANWRPPEIKNNFASMIWAPSATD
ncbi:MAG: hypothetical protein KCHDKBKB_00807 [Elusimicrobia bacterium]|nr:hypothetical protein [Elusimicrobiota bacterium]